MKKIGKFLFVAALGALLCLVLTGCGKTKVDVSQYLSMRVDGYNGYATAYMSLDKSELEGSVMVGGNDEDSWEKLGEMTALAYTMEVEPEKVENVKNGDKITVKVTVDEDMAKRAGYKFTGLKKTFTVEGLQDAVALDPFAEDIFGMGKLVDVQLQGAAPNGQLHIANNAAPDDPLSRVTYQLDRSGYLNNGDVVTVTAALDRRAEGYALSRTEAALTLTGFASYVTDPSQIPADTLRAMANAACERVLGWGTSSVFTSLYSSDNFECFYSDISNHHAGGTAILAYGSRWFGLDYDNYVLIPVYVDMFVNDYTDPATGEKGPTTLTDVFMYVSFKNVIIQQDGSVTYDIQKDSDSFFSDMSAAEREFLPSYRELSTVIEFNMP